MAGRALGSKWGALSPALLATIYPVDLSGVRIPGENYVVTPPSDGNMEVTANWQSPFEQMGPEAKMPAVFAMLQSGTLQSYVDTLFGKGTDAGSGGVGGALSAFATEAAGRTGLTKLNSHQVFNGAPPFKITLTLQFRAFDNPATEVEEPINALMQWALPRKLAANGAIVEIVNGLRNGQGFIKSFMPSEAPIMVGLTYGGQTFSPLVIESISTPINVARRADGVRLNASLQIALASLTALDADDWRRSLANLPARMFNTPT